MALWPFVMWKLSFVYPHIADGLWDSSPWAAPGRALLGVLAPVLGGRGSIFLWIIDQGVEGPDHGGRGAEASANASSRLSVWPELWPELWLEVWLEVAASCVL